jgi:ADP-heptose:LPS heptosyltransferase
MKFLIIRLHQTDKIFASIALVKAIKSKYPQAVIHYVSSIGFEAYLSKFSEIEKMFFVQGDITPTVIALLKEKYTYTIDLQGNARSRFITSHLGQQFNAILTKYSYPAGLIRKLFSAKYFNVSDLTTQFIKCTKDLGLSTANLKWYYPTSEVDALQKNDIPMSHSLGYYCINVCNKNKTQIANAIQRIQFPVVLMGTLQDFDVAEGIKMLDPIKIYNACGKYSEGEQCTIMAGSRLNVVHDNVLSSIAAALPIAIIDTNALYSHIAELEPFCSNSGIKYQKAIWTDENDVTNRISDILKIKN